MKKKLLVFINYFGKTSETFISDEIKFLSEQESIDLSVLHYGPSIRHKNIYGLSMPSSLQKRWLNAPEKLNFLVFKSLRYKSGLNGSLAYFIKFFKNNFFDTIYCHFGTNGKIIAQLKAIGVISSKTKVIVRFHGLDMWFERYPVGFYDILNKYANKIVVGSEYAYQNLITYHINKELIYKLPVGIKERNISSNNLFGAPRRFNIISVGRLIELKGYLVGLAILNELNKLGVNCFYTIIGDGPQYHLINETILKYNLQGKVEVIKGLNHNKVLEKLKSSHIYLYPGIKDSSGRAESQGLANLEAMAQGLVIVASNVGGVSDYVLPNKTGFLCQAGAMDEFVKSLVLVMGNYNTEEISKIRQNAIKMVAEHYCQENLNNKLLFSILRNNEKD